MLVDSRNVCHGDRGTATGCGAPRNCGAIAHGRAPAGRGWLMVEDVSNWVESCWPLAKRRTQPTATIRAPVQCADDHICAGSRFSRTPATDSLTDGSALYV